MEDLPPRTPVRTTPRGLFRAIRSLRPDIRFALRMPGQSYTGPLPPLTETQRNLAQSLRADVEHLATAIGERNIFNPRLLAAAERWLLDSLGAMGLNVERQPYQARGVQCANLSAEIRGTSVPDEIVVFGAHYDAVMGCPAANDNGSGVAATLAVARALTSAGVPRPARSIRFVFFVNEEPPFFWTEEMGSDVYARACKERGDNIVAMLTPETIGCYSDEPGSQRYPIPIKRFYPDKGDFIAFIGMYEARALIRLCVEIFRKNAAFPSVGAGLPGIVPHVGASDHWSFWRQGYPALMVTDTAPYRYTHYHRATDTPDKLDYEKMARVVEGLQRVVEELAGVGAPPRAFG